ncbi:MAG: BlaI/MecI/CopY family transcriptional regulator [Selenomonadaceae bacterium]
MRLTESELQIMELFWTTEKPLAGPDILTLSPADKLWKDNSLYIMIQTLLRKGAIEETGAVKGEKGKYLRVFRPTLSREDYCTQQLQRTLDTESVPALFSTLIKDADLSEETIGELEEILRCKKVEMKEK